MTPEERIAQLEGELAAERAERQRLSETLRVMCETQARMQVAEMERRNVRAARNTRHRHRDVSVPVSCASPETSQAPSPPLDGSPLSSTPSLSSPLSSPLPVSSSKGTASPSPGDFELTSPASKRKPREPSAAERLFATLQRTRQERCAEIGEPVVPETWDVARQNKALKPLLTAEEGARTRFERAWGIYLADDGQRVREPAWSLSFFMSSGVRAKYETIAAREEEG